MVEDTEREIGRILLETATDAIVVVDQETLEIIEANPSACRLFDYSQDEIKGLLLTDLSAEPEQSEKALRAGQSRVSKRIMKRKCGATVPMEISAQHVQHDGRQVSVGFMRDISERLQAEEALRQSEEKFAAAFRTSPDSVNINRLSDGLYLDINQGFTDLTGYTEEDIAGKTSKEIDIWGNSADREALVAALKEFGRCENFEAEFRMKNGRVRIGLLSARVLEVDGEPCILSVTRDISQRKQMERALLRSNERHASMSRDVIGLMGRIVEIRDPYTQGHQLGVSKIARAIASVLGFSEAEVDAIETAGLLHDVGKLSIPVEILAKPGRLSGIEMDMIRTHADYGHDILKDVEFPWPVAEYVVLHHERMDGSGYPRGLAEDEIPMPGRVLAVADVVEAMASHRPYRPALGLERAIEELQENPQLYDSDVVCACIDLYERGKIAV